MIRLFPATLLLAFFGSTQALAEPIPVTNRVVVTTADLDFTASSGQQRLERRLAIAVIEVCGEASSVDLVGSNAVRRCHHETRAQVSAYARRAIALAQGSSTVALAAR